MASSLGSVVNLFTLNFHGLGVPHSGATEAEIPHWCSEDLYKRFLDAVVELRDTLSQTTKFQITFDDGNKSDLAIGVPALVERGLDATFFVCSARLNDPAYLDPDDLAEMRAQGMTIGCHGATHIPLRGLDDQTLKAETIDARAVLEDALGDSVSAFAIPFGSYDRRVLAALTGFKHVHTSDFQIARVGARMVTRHGYHTGWGVDDFRASAIAPPTGPKAMIGKAKLLIKKMRP